MLLLPSLLRCLAPCAAACVLWACGSAARAAAAPGKVYLVLGSDTAVWNVAGGVDVTKLHNHFVPEVYTQPTQNGYRIMDPVFRAGLTDSFGQQLKLTWWMLVGDVYAKSDNTDVPIPNLMPMYLMRKYHGTALRGFGDEFSLHYHTFLWSDYNGDGTSFWNEARTFHECRADFDLALAESLLEEETFPASFRSGWHYMDNEWQSYLNTLLPYSLHNASPTVRADTVEPYDNVYDWSQAPLAFVPFHPATTNYQVPGDGLGWNVRSIKFPNVTQTIMNQMFAAASKGTDQVACLWAHLPESDFIANVVQMDTYAHVAAGKYPTVSFRYCTAAEAMQRWRGLTNPPSLQLTVGENWSGEQLMLTLQTSEPIFQAQPFVAVKDVCEEYRVLPCLATGSNSWTVPVPVPRGRIAKLGIAVTDRAGNPTTRLLRYLPDDLFIDNLDPQFSSSGANWRGTNAPSAWGTNVMVATLRSNEVALARWTVPVSNSGPYKIFGRVPLVANAASNFSFTASSGGSNGLAAFFPQAWPSNTWMQIGTAFLDATKTNYVELTVAGGSQAGALAVADVIKVSPLLPGPSFVSALQVDPADTTANIRWRTAALASTLVQYGTNLNFGMFSATNFALVTDHVMTLARLVPNTTYYFEAESVARGTQYMAQCFFTTTSSNAAPPRLNVLRSGSRVTLYWNGSGLTLQRTLQLNSSNIWSNVPGPMTNSPYDVGNGQTGFYRLAK